MARVRPGIGVGGLLGITRWVLKWDDSVEVFAGRELRARIASIACSVAARFAHTPELADNIDGALHNTTG